MTTSPPGPRAGLKADLKTVEAARFRRLLRRRRPADAAFRTVRGPAAPGRNARCPCGSGLKYKHCHLAEPASSARAKRDGAAARAFHLAARPGTAVLLRGIRMDGATPTELKATFDVQPDRVRIGFDAPVAGMVLTPDQAEQWAAVLMAKAKEAREIPPPAEVRGAASDHVVIDEAAR